LTGFAGSGTQIVELEQMASGPGQFASAGGPQWLVEGARPSHDQRRARADDYQPEADGFVEEVLAELFKELGLPDVWALLDQL